MHAKFWSENLRGGDHFRRYCGYVILKWILKKKGVTMRTGFTWLMLGSSGGLF
jgi:hypothetical protein